MTNTLTVEDIQKSDSIPEFIKRKLEGLEEQDLKPVALTKWAREIFHDGRKVGRGDAEIIEWIWTYATKRAYSQQQINFAISSNNVQRYTPRPGSGGSSSRGQIGNLIPVLKKLTQEFTGVDETEIKQADYSPKTAVKLAKDNVVDYVSATEEQELRANLRWINILRGLLDSMAEEIEAKLRSRAKYGSRIER